MDLIPRNLVERAFKLSSALLDCFFTLPASQRELTRDLLEVITDEPRSEQAIRLCSASIFASCRRNLANVSAFSASASALAFVSRALASSKAAFNSARFSSRSICRSFSLLANELVRFVV